MIITTFEGADKPQGAEVEVSWTELIELLEPTRGEKEGAGWCAGKFLGAYRRAANFASAELVVFDIDDATPDELVACFRRISESGTACALHPTHTAGRWRLVIPLASEVQASDYSQARASIAERFSVPGVDPSTKDLARFYYFPRLEDGDERQLEVLEGEPAKVEKKPTPPKAMPPATSLSDYAKRVRGHGDETLRRILHNEPIAEKGNRDNTVHRVASLLSHLTPDVDVDVVCEFVRPAILRMECEPEGAAHWEKVFRSSYERGLLRKMGADGSKALTLFEGKPERPAEAKLKFTPKGAIAVTGLNCLELLRTSGLRFRFNLLTRQLEANGLTCKPGDLGGVVKNFLSEKFDFNMKTSEILEQVSILAHEDIYNPVTELLQALKWDGVPRIESFLTHYMGAVPRTTEHAGYLKVISRAFLIQAAMRGLRPGCHAHAMLILKGRQGAGKSMALRALGGDFYSNPPMRFKDKDSRLAMACSWIIEVEELASVNEVSVEELKAFISTSHDSYRPPYGRAQETFPRTCVLVGTTNKDQLFYDPSGYRRFWVATVGHNVNLGDLRRDRDQLWAEAVHFAQAGEAYHLTGGWARYAEAEANRFATRSDYIELTRKWLQDMKEPPALIMVDSLMHSLGIPLDRRTEKVRRQFSRALLELGFERVVDEGKEVFVMPSVPPVDAEKIFEET